MKHSIFGIVALAAQVCFGFTFYARTLEGNVYTLRGEDSTKVSVIQEQFEQASGMPVKQQRMIFKGRQLESDKVLADYGIQEGSEGNQTAGSAFEFCKHLEEKQTVTKK
ncbi:Ubiquitin [Cordyceps fumosorosea ARSEF 2679]|uniref:Ubiquitin n=1 Tax=Cordyceps fumosorosea (strain ARSEF 2679) TaxID=1081104 RepID=A0A167TMC7_CORFA|nr:Ubiquitin [Cordyceps fumosorosea ARSEF 2679]OAA60747.1 Ubiquitin [Cordyceps fumosorosea ARSEF 2679]